MVPVRRLTAARRAPPHEAAQFDKPVMYAIKAIAQGRATEHQQQLAMKWIIERCAETYTNPYHPASARDTDFAAGKAWVGQQLVGLINMDPDAFKKAAIDE